MFDSTRVFLLNFASLFWQTLRELSPYLILGLLLAGCLHVLVSARLLGLALGKKGWKGALRGALLGVPLPLCSCSVVPSALTLRRRGASLSSVASFSISSPETSLDALALTAVLLPFAFLGLRPLAAFLLAVLVGIFVERFSVTTKQELHNDLLQFSSLEFSDFKKETKLCHICGILADQEHTHGVLKSLKAIFQYAFLEFFSEIAVWLFLGIFIAVLLQIFLPSDFASHPWWGKHPHLQVVFLVLIGIPLYSCAAASTPLAAVLFLKGFAPGAVLAFLLTGPATNLGTLFIFSKEIGKRVTLLYTFSILLISTVMGIVVNLLWPWFVKFPFLTQITKTPATHWISYGMPAWLETSSSVLLLALTVYSFFKLHFFSFSHHKEHDTF